MELHTERLLLRELREPDAPFCNAYERDPEVVRYMSFDPLTLAQSLDYIRKVRRESDEGSPRRLFDLAIVPRGLDHPIGRAGLHVVRPEHREGTLWYVLHPDHWGKGYATEAMSELCSFGFGPLGLHRLFADCDPRNLASQRVAEKLGMRREAHLRENYFLKGEWCDSLIYGLLDREWRERTSAVTR